MSCHNISTRHHQGSAVLMDMGDMRWCLLQPWTERKSISVLRGFIFVASLSRTNSVWKVTWSGITERGRFGPGPEVCFWCSWSREGPGRPAWRVISVNMKKTKSDFLSVALLIGSYWRCNALTNKQIYRVVSFFKWLSLLKQEGKVHLLCGLIHICANQELGTDSNTV